ncbi:MAG: V-type ATP synthase subunit E family protein [Blastococcus sp.]
MRAVSRADLRTALEPVRRGLLARARADADALLAQADTDAEATLAAARVEAAALLAQARAEGERDAEVVRARERARARREARATVLRAQAAVYDEVRRQGRAAVRALRSDPAYPALLDALRARAHAELGPDAAVREHPDGGLVAEVPGRRLDARLDTLADAALDGLGGAVRQLWAPTSADGDGA